MPCYSRIKVLNEQYIQSTLKLALETLTKLGYNIAIMQNMVTATKNRTELTLVAESTDKIKVSGPEIELSTFVKENTYRNIQRWAANRGYSVVRKNDIVTVTGYAG